MLKKRWKTHAGVVINEVLDNVSQPVQGSLPCAASMKKTIRRKWNKISAPPPDPVDLYQLSLPDEYTYYEEEDFPLKDSGPREDIILIFGRKSWLQHLVSSEVWYVDGTFKIAPKLFSQVYIVLAQRFSGVIPIIYALLPNKQRATYLKLSEMLKECVPTINPKSIICDFEVAAFSALQEIFPQVEIKGCFFHLSQNMQKKLASSGATQGYQIGFFHARSGFF